MSAGWIAQIDAVKGRRQNQPMVEDLRGQYAGTVGRVHFCEVRNAALKWGLLVLAALAIGTLALPSATGSALLVWNTTPSAPSGVYRIERVRWAVGDRVAVLPSQELAVDLDVRGVLPRGKLLIKRVVAVTGDAVCRREGTVFVNGVIMAQAKSNDSAGRPLPSWQGCTRLDKGQVFLLGDTEGSYDGRYFGVTRVDDVVGQAQLVLAF